MLCQSPGFPVQKLYKYLRSAVRYGARAARLVQHVPGIIELLYPADRYPDVSEHSRALKVEADIRRAVVEDIGGAPGRALATILCLPPGTLGRKLLDRRRIAGSYLGIDAETFRHAPHEGALLLDLAVEIHRHATRHIDTQQPTP